jgi:N-acetylglucosamine kinase-like BadF-type ATPase
MARALREAIESSFASASHPVSRVSVACLGMTGGVDVAPQIVEQIVGCDAVRACEDSVTALAGASVAEPGVVVIAGTGAVAYGRAPDGREAKAGGWGFIMGDEGSGYDIGIMALRALTQAADGRGPQTALTASIPAHFGVPNLRGVHAIIYSSTAGRPQIAALAAVVSQAASAGDRVAQALLAEAGGHLARLALAVLARLDALEARIAVYPTGGVFQAGDWVLEPFAAALRDGARQATVQSPAFPPVVGALLIALQMAGAVIDGATVTRIRASLPPL